MAPTLTPPADVVCRQGPSRSRHSASVGAHDPQRLRLIRWASDPLRCRSEVSGHLVGSTAFKAAGTGAPRPAGSIPVHLRHQPLRSVAPR